jgi:hypothetical protein
MATADQMISKLAESVRTAHDEREANEALRFASGYLRALDDFGIVTAEQSATARKQLVETRQAWGRVSRAQA